MDRKLSDGVLVRIGDHKLAASFETYLSSTGQKRSRTPDRVNYSDISSEWKNLLAAKGPEAISFFQHLLDIKTRYTFLSRLIEMKLLKNLEAALFCLESHNDLALALCARSIYEQVGSLSFMHRKSTVFLEDIRKFSSFAEALARADSLIETYRIQMLGTGFFKSQEDLEKLGLRKVENVMKLIDTADKVIPQFRRHYDLLSEVVHPNYFSNAIITNANLLDWSPEPDLDFQADLRTWIFDALAGALDAMEHYTDDWFWRFLYEIDHLYRKILFSDRPFKDLFREAKFGLSGDGKSQTSAIQFHASSWRDHFRMLDHYKAKHSPAGQMRVIAEMQDAKFHYDQYLIGSESLFIRIPKDFDFPATTSNRWLYGKAVFQFNPSHVDDHQEFSLVQAELPPRLVPEFIFLLKGNDPEISAIAKTRPFGLYIDTAGVWSSSDHCPVLFIKFRVSREGVDGPPVKELVHIANPQSETEMNAFRSLAKQTHVHLFILNERHEQIDFFEFNNTFQIDQVAEMAEQACRGMKCQDFAKAKNEFLIEHPHGLN